MDKLLKAFIMMMICKGSRKPRKRCGWNHKRYISSALGNWFARSEPQSGTLGIKEDQKLHWAEHDTELDSVISGLSVGQSQSREHLHQMLADAHTHA